MRHPVALGVSHRAPVDLGLLPRAQRDRHGGIAYHLVVPPRERAGGGHAIGKGDLPGQKADALPPVLGDHVREPRNGSEKPGLASPAVRIRRVMDGFLACAYPTNPRKPGPKVNRRDGVTPL
ncbi:hypothetical protein, partial [Micromonospora harpali]